MRTVSPGEWGSNSPHPCSCRATGQRLRNIPQRFVHLRSVVATHERPAMKKIKAHSLTGRITPKLMEQAFQAVRRNRGAAGVDKVSINMFDANREENLAALMRDLKTGAFRPRPLRRASTSPKAPVPRSSGHWAYRWFETVWHRK